MTSSEGRDLRRRYGVQFGTLQIIHQTLKALQRDGLSFKQVHAAITNIHPKVMSNLRIDRKGQITVKNKRLRWWRRHGWLSKWKMCFGCGRFLDRGYVLGKLCHGCDYSNRHFREMRLISGRRIRAGQKRGR